MAYGQDQDQPKQGLKQYLGPAMRFTGLDIAVTWLFTLLVLLALIDLARAQKEQQVKDSGREESGQTADIGRCRLRPESSRCSQCGRRQQAGLANCVSWRSSLLCPLKRRTAR